VVYYKSFYFLHIYKMNKKILRVLIITSIVTWILWIYYNIACDRHTIWNIFWYYTYNDSTIFSYYCESIPRPLDDKLKRLWNIWFPICVFLLFFNHIIYHTINKNNKIYIITLFVLSILIHFALPFMFNNSISEISRFIIEILWTILLPFYIMWWIYYITHNKPTRVYGLIYSTVISIYFLYNMNFWWWAIVYIPYIIEFVWYSITYGTIFWRIFFYLPINKFTKLILFNSIIINMIILWFLCLFFFTNIFDWKKFYWSIDFLCDLSKKQEKIYTNYKIEYYAKDYKFSGNRETPKEIKENNDYINMIENALNLITENKERHCREN